METFRALLPAAVTAGFQSVGLGLLLEFGTVTAVGLQCCVNHALSMFVPRINRMGAEGLDPTIQKMLQIIQDSKLLEVALQVYDI
jgi:hypothetical protein